MADNQVKFKGHFGCGLMVYHTTRQAQVDGDDDEEEEETYGDLKRQLDAGIDLWQNHRSFFFSVEGRMQFDFTDEAYRLSHLVQGKIIDLELQFNELKVFHGDEEISSEESDLNWRLRDLRTIIVESGLNSLLGAVAGFLQVPLSPFPKVEKCLGLAGNGSFMEINDGCAIIGYDFRVKRTNAECLFN
jgi:hypothetical protein